MKMNILVLLMACATALPALSADNVDIKVTGRIIAAPCVFNGGNSNMNIDLGNIQATNMFTPGSSSDPVSFNLLFTRCPPGTLSVTTRFSGTAKMPMKAMVTSVAGRPTPGSIRAVVVLTMQYN